MFAKIARLVLAPALATVLAVACGPNEGTVTDPGQSSSSDEAFPVGVSTVMINEFISAEVWYPAAAASNDTETYDVRDFAPFAIRSMLTGDAPSTFAYAASRDSAVASGKFPVVLFSHGFGGFRSQSTFLTAHLASRGMIVIAPDHPSRDLSAALTGGTFETDDPQIHLLESLEFLSNDEETFANHVDVESVAIVGHSAGGGTALVAASDERVDGYVSMASGRLGPAEENAMPDKPSFFLAGSVDQIVPVARTREAFEAAPSPSLFWNIQGVGHNGFDDLCTFGNGLGIVGVAIASGLERLLEMQPQMRSLGEDGCVPPARPVAETFPIIKEAIAEWLTALFAGTPGEPAASSDVVVEAK
jgi:dienelactone hydrolase